MNRRPRLAALLVTSCATAAVLVPAATGSAATPAARFDGILNVSDTTPALGSRIVLRGHLSAAAPHEEAVLEVYYNNRSIWKIEDVRRMNGSRHYAFTESVTTDRSRKYRVIVVRGHGHGQLKTVPVTVVPHP